MIRDRSRHYRCIHGLLWLLQQRLPLALTATQQLRARRFDTAIAALDRRASAYEAEIVRLRGEALLARSPANVADAEATFQQALAVADQQSNRAAKLRTCTRLDRLWAAHEARELLAPVCGTFTEGFDKQALMAAKTLLAELN